MNLYQWEESTRKALAAKGDMGLSLVLIGAGVVIILIGVFSRSVLFKSLVAAYVLLP